VRKIGILSDTHGNVPPGVFTFFKECDEIWHAGDIGDFKVITVLKSICPVRAVFGNIDGGILRKEFPEDLSFYCEKVKVLITHIGGYPGHYPAKNLAALKQEQPQLFICGHSHILKVMYDVKLKLLHLNPGAAGNSGWHNSITLMRFQIREDRIEELEIYDIPRSGRAANM